MSAPRKFDAETRARAVQERQREAALDEAARDLAAARRQLDDAVEHARSKGRHYAGRINDAIEDDVKDSWWDNVKDRVDRHADAIKLVTKVLSYVVTALAIVALFIPGLNIAVLVLTGILLAGQTLLAASGNGSWVDVALTVFALATFGLGAVAAAWAQGCPGRDPGGRGTGRPHDGQERRPTLEQCRPHRGRADPGPPQRDRCPTPRCPPEHRRRSPPGPSSR